MPLCDGSAQNGGCERICVSIPDGIIASLRRHIVDKLIEFIISFNPRRDYCLFATVGCVFIIACSFQFQSQTGLLPLCDWVAHDQRRQEVTFQSQTGLLPLCDCAAGLPLVSKLLSFNPRRDYCLFATRILQNRKQTTFEFQSQTGLLPLCDLV